MFPRLLILLLGLLLLNFSLGQRRKQRQRPLPLGLPEGKDCPKKGNITTVCTKLTSCPEIGDFKKNHPQICSFSGKEPIVCCPKIIRKAKTKCDEYERYHCIPNLIRAKRSPQFFRPTVVGGTKAQPFKYPHMALVGFGPSTSKQWLCGGSLISTRFVLSAAHCSNAPGKGNARWVRLGELDLSSSTDEAKPEDFEIKKIINHPDYKPPAAYNDIVLFKLDRGVKFSKWIMPICLNLETEINSPTAYAAGWGRTDFVGPTSSHLLVVDLNIIEGELCKSLLNNPGSKKLPRGVDLKSMICAGELAGGKDTCAGDSGGPLAITKGICLPTLVGITSTGRQCALENSPGLYTRVSNYLPWIESIVWP